MPTVPSGRRGRTARRVLRLAILALLPALLPLGAQRAELERSTTRQLLPNGLEVIVAPARGVPLATVELVVRNGAFTQPPEYAGLAHLFEHMFFKANDAYPEPDAFMDRAANLGAVFNATTREEQVTYYLTVVADSLEGGMRFLSAALRGAQFRADELDRGEGDAACRRDDHLEPVREELPGGRPLQL
ncbi:MAG: M16 family metallopeptidase, partial [Gemmatimonadota bacterium]